MNVLLPIATVIFAVWFVARYVCKLRKRDDNTVENAPPCISQQGSCPEKQGVEQAPRQSIFTRSRGKMTPLDILPLVVITLVYACVAFFNLGDRQAPQSGWMAREETSASVTIDLGEEVELYRIVYFGGVLQANPLGSGLFLRAEHWEVSEEDDSAFIPVVTERKEFRTASDAAFVWREFQFNSQGDDRTRYLHLTALRTFQVNELGIYVRDADGEITRLDPANFDFFDDENAKALFDEQLLIPGQIAAQGNGQEPQTGWPAREEPPSQTVMFSLGEEVELYRIVHFNGVKHGNIWQDPNLPPCCVIRFQTRLSADEPWVERETLRAGFNDVFYWRDLQLGGGEHNRARYIRLISVRTFQVNEMGIYVRDADGEVTRLDPANFDFFGDENAARLFDEQHLIPEHFTFTNQMYFDEIYHGRTAYEVIHGIYPYETTHPPLGKAIISLGIRMFGMTPFGWRFMGVVFGIMMLPFFYWLLKGLFNKTLVAAAGTTLLATEFMLITQSRIATIDTYTVFFIIVSYLFMFRYITSGLDAPLKKTLLPLFLSGLAFGLGVASKWPVLYAGLGLLAFYVMYQVARIRHAKKQGVDWVVFLSRTLSASIIFFIFVPVTVYVVSYAPYVQNNHERIVSMRIPEDDHYLVWQPSGECMPLTANNLWDKAWSNSIDMLSYHGGNPGDSAHPFAAAWYHWLVNARPMLFYADWGWCSDNGQWVFLAGFASFNNPLISWAGLLALFAVAWAFFRKRHCLATVFIVVGFLSQFAPWLLISRETYAYHYFPSIIFLILALAYIFNDLLDMDIKQNRRWVVGFAGASVVLFALFLPVLIGIPIPSWYLSGLQWLPNWPF
ncbi:MAG: phospholipid carrier-dependent glycosyltransferase [Oscillospiraceae bacterium]|nr:phospholipid carrier-dependent glycosyltransferase [Oscillospiraceae bacterium]